MSGPAEVAPRNGGWLRRVLWDAIRNDDAAGLLQAIKYAALDNGMGQEELVRHLGLWLWRRNGCDRPRPCSLVGVLAGQERGAPPEGSVRCLAEVLRRFSPASGAFTEHDLLEAHGKARALGRGECARLIEASCAGLLDLADFND